MKYVTKNRDSLIAHGVPKRPQGYTTEQVTKLAKPKQVSRCPYKQKGSTTTYENLDEH